MTDYQAEKIWDALNQTGDMDEGYKSEFILDCKEYGLLVAVYNLGWRHGSEA